MSAPDAYEKERVQKTVDCAEEIDQHYWHDKDDAYFKAFNEVILKSIASNDLSPTVKLWRIFRQCNEKNAMLIHDFFYYLCGDGIDKLWENAKQDVEGEKTSSFAE